MRQGLRQPRELAGAEGRFAGIGGIEVHYQAYGYMGNDDGAVPSFVLLHGFGASEFSWHGVAGLLAELGKVIAFDRPGFGLSGRPMPGEWAGADSPYSDSGYLALTLGLMDELGVERAVLVGHSAGGGLAAAFAAAHPERVEALILEAPALGGRHHQLPAALRWLASTPLARRLGPWITRMMGGRLELLVERAWHDPAKLDETTRAAYRRPLTVANWDRALWEILIAPRGSAGGVYARLAHLGIPVLFITGDDDRIVSPQETTRAAGLVPGAGLAVVPHCGHIPHEECPSEFMAAMRAFVEGLVPATARLSPR